jgi:hypothetical protein
MINISGVPESGLKAAAEMVVAEQNAAADRIKKQAKVRAERNKQAVSAGGIVKEMSIPAESYHYWGKRLGYSCWSDNKFKAEYKRDNPWCTVAQPSKSSVTGVAVPWDRKAPSEQDGWKRVGSRWRKVYA